MDNSAHNTPNYPSNSVLRICPEVSISLHTRNSICNVPESEAWRRGSNTHPTTLIVNKAKTYFVNIKEGISLPFS
jgi:hypothetical protein